MLYDVFISHASEDKDDFVRPLAEALRQRRVEVWYDEFSLSAGMSLRRSIDQGLAKSRFGVVVLSPHFFGKSWPEWELNGLVQRHLNGSHAVILPIWHGVAHSEVATYSPPLADVVAIPSSANMDDIVNRLLRSIRPEGSALIRARDVLLDYGYDPPVVSDDWWLDVIERSGWLQDGRRWCLPVSRMTDESSDRGERLAWIVMQHLWQDEAEQVPVTQITPPAQVTAFILKHRGLLEIARAMPRVIVEHAPQLAIPGFGGPLEEPIEEAYQLSVRECAGKRARNDPSGSALTTDGFCPACDERFAVRHPTFGNYIAAMVACEYVQGGGAGLGPHTRAFEPVDYLIWLLSRMSMWLPTGHRAFLLQGMKEWAVWPWMSASADTEYQGDHSGALYKLLMETRDSRQIQYFRLTEQAMSDIQSRIEYSRHLLRLPEPKSELVDSFLANGIPQSWFAAQDLRGERRKKNGSRTSKGPPNSRKG